MTIRTYTAEAADLVDGDNTIDCEGDKPTAESYARRWSRQLSERAAYVVAMAHNGSVVERVGHRVFIDGVIDRTEGDY